MNTTLIDFQTFIEWDNSPFVLFDAQGNILYLNSTAEILFGYVSKKELYDISVAYASKNFGYKTTSITLNYDSFIFHAITVGYENEEQISLRLYHMPRPKPSRKIAVNKLITTDINTLLEANISLFKTKNSNPLRLLTDQDLPAFKIDQNIFSRLLRKTFETFKASDYIDISLKLLFGQHVIIEGKKESLVQLSIIGNTRSICNDNDISALAIESHTKCFLKENTIKLEIPLIQ